MRGRRILAIVVGILGLLILAVIAVLFIFSSGTDDQPADPGVVEQAPEAGEALEPGATPSPTPELVEVVVSLQTVPRGFQMTEAELTTEERLISEVSSNVITNIDDAIGLYARHEIFQGETMTKDSLVRDPTLIASENFGPSSLVPSNWVAMAVPLDRLNSVAYGLAPGDSVDVMLTFTLSAIDEQFQTLLSNSATFFLQQPGTEGGDSQPSIFVIDPFGRFENVPTGDIAHIAPSEDTQRPIPVSILIQNARVVEVGAYTPRPTVAPPTPTPEPDAPTPTPGGPPPTPTPPPPDVILVALPPQQQLILNYALEVSADIDFALRRTNDGDLREVQNIDFAFLLEQFGIVVPPNTDFTIGGLETTSLEGVDAGTTEEQP